MAEEQGFPSAGVGDRSQVPSHPALKSSKHKRTGASESVAKWVLEEFAWWVGPRRVCVAGGSSKNLQRFVEMSQVNTKNTSGVTDLQVPVVDWGVGGMGNPTRDALSSNPRRAT